VPGSNIWIAICTWAEEWVDLLLAEDPLLHGFSRLAPETQARERYFLLNSVKGVAGYLAEKLR
jgi:hypothetical protein